MTKYLSKYVQFLSKMNKITSCTAQSRFYSTFTMETNNFIDRYKSKISKHDILELSVQHFISTSSKNNVSQMSIMEVENMLNELLSKNKDKLIIELIKECQICHKYINFLTLKKLLKHYSENGKPNIIIILQNYCAKANTDSYQRNGEFLHYLAIAECMKGNSEKGLSILKTSYSKYDTLRSLYRIILRDLIQDSVLNRSEATLIIFKNYVLEFSEQWADHYPLVCFWHICWASNWFSDQMLSNELLESSETLQNIVKEKASAFSIMALRDYNEDAVLRLLQMLLKYDMMSEYVAVLQVLFNYKLRNRDIRGCTEIIRNCEVLGISLPSNQQGRYITMLIKDKKRSPEESSIKIPFKNFKLKF